MLHNPDWRQIFAPQGTLLHEGELIRRTNYSRTLESIAVGGAGAFYSVRILPRNFPSSRPPNKAPRARLRTRLSGKCAPPAGSSHMQILRTTKSRFSLLSRVVIEIEMSIPRMPRPQGRRSYICSTCWRLTISSAKEERP